MLHSIIKCTQNPHSLPTECIVICVPTNFLIKIIKKKITSVNQQNLFDYVDYIYVHTLPTAK